MLKLIEMNMFRIILVLFLVSCSNAVINKKSENYDSRVRLPNHSLHIRKFC